MPVEAPSRFHLLLHHVGLEGYQLEAKEGKALCVEMKTSLLMEWKIKIKVLTSYLSALGC